MNQKYILTIKASARPGLLHLITGIIEKKLIAICSLNMAPTDIHDIVFITIEINVSDKEVNGLSLKLQNVIEVFAVDAMPYEKALSVRATYFKLCKSFLETPNAALLQKHAATIVNLYDDTIMVSKYGNDAVIRQLYNELEGPFLLGFSQTGLIAASKLIGEDESSVISWAA